MIALVTTVILQAASCQNGPLAEPPVVGVTAQRFLDAVQARDVPALQKVTRPGAVWLTGETTYSDTQIYELLRSDNSARERVDVIEMIGTDRTVAIITALRDVADSDDLTVLSIEDGCIVRVEALE
jgi:hypothetical protein